MNSTTPTFENFPTWAIEKWQEIADILAETLDIPAALIMKMEKEFIEVFISSHSENNPYTAGNKEFSYGLYCETVLKTQDRLLITNALKNKKWNKNPGIKLGMIAYLGFPLNFPDKKPFGTLCILDRKERRFSPLEERLILQFRNIIELDLALMQSFEIKTSQLAPEVLQQTAELKRKEKAIEAKQALLTAIVNSPSDLFIFSLDKNYCYTSYNEKHRLMMKQVWNVDIECGMDMVKCIGKPEISLLLKHSVDRALSKESVTEIQHYQEPNLHYEMNMNPIYQENQVVGVTAFIKDISERIKFEQELLEAKEKVEENEIRLKMAQAASKVGTWDWDIVENTFFWSDEFLQIFGLPEDTQAGFEAWTKALHPDDVQNAATRIQESIENKNELTNDYRIILPTGEIRWIRARGTTVYEDDKPLRMIGLCFDITSQKSIELELIRAKEKAEESDRLKSAFLANMSHEIRTPMNGILGFSELLKDPGLSGDEQKRYIEMIEKAGARMLNIINDLISISKLESRQMGTSVSRISINTKIDYVYNLFKPEAERKRISLVRNIPLTLNEATVNTDGEKIYAILSNLVNNAIKFTQEGAIEFGFVQKDKFFEFFVKDTGIGIPADRQDAIFERFIHADLLNKNASQGAGLGLSISKAYVEMLGGKIWLESAPGKGTAFYFTIPAA